MERDSGRVELAFQSSKDDFGLVCKQSEITQTEDLWGLFFHHVVKPVGRTDEYWDAQQQVMGRITGEDGQE